MKFILQKCVAWFLACFPERYLIAALLRKKGWSFSKHRRIQDRYEFTFTSLVKQKTDEIQ